MKALITIELDYKEQIYDLYETKEIRFYDKDGVYMLWEGGFVIKPIPDKIDQGYPCDKYEEGYGDGWDECINEILGGNE